MIEMVERPKPTIEAERGTTPPEWSAVTLNPASAGERIISAAAYLFCRDGIAATGVDSIIAQANTAKSTLYVRFGSKDNLVQEVLEAEGAAWRRWVFGRLAALDAPPAGRLLALFDILKDWFEDPEFYGCPFINAISEANPADDRYRKMAAQHKSHLVQWLQAQATDIGTDDPQAFAQKMIVLIDGAIVAAQATGKAAFATTAKDVAALLLESEATRARGMEM